MSTSTKEVLVHANRDRFVHAWPKHAEGVESLTITLHDALTRRFETDAYLVAYAPTPMARRLDKSVIATTETLEAIGGCVRMQLFVADVDRHGESAESVDSWFEAERVKIDALLASHPDLIVYRTKGGYRLVGLMPEPFEIRDNDDAKNWARLVMAWRAYVRRQFGIEMDALHDWTRFNRVPHGTRDGQGSPEDREIIGSTDTVGHWDPELSDEDWNEAERELAPQTKPRDTSYGQSASRAPGAPTLFRELLKARGMLGRYDGQKWTVVCPGESEHGDPTGVPDNDTVLYENDGVWGGIWCLHSNCNHDRRRSAKDWMGYFSKREIEDAKQACGVVDQPRQRAQVAPPIEYGPEPDTYVTDGALALDMAEQGPESVPSNVVRPNQWAKQESKTGSTLHVFDFPGIDSEDDATSPAPTATVPEPDHWADFEDMPDPPPVPRASTGKLDAVTVVTVATRLLQIIDANFEGFVHDGGKFWLYRDGVYAKLPDWWLLKAAKAYEGASDNKGPNSSTFCANITNLKSIQGLIAIDLAARQNIPGDRSFFDDSPALATFTNGSLIAGDDGCPTLVEHSPVHRARHRFDFEYEPGLVPSNFIAVARDWFAGLPEEEVEARILALRQYAGHTVLNSLHRKKLSVALMLVGKGHDGKSTFINLLRACLPPGSTAELDPAALGAKSNTVDLTRSALHGKLANICDDCSAQPWADTSFLKRVLDHAWVSARHIQGNPFTFRATLASVFACNELPRVSDKSWGFFRRWLLVHFPHTISMANRDARLEQKILGLEKRQLVCWFVDAALAMLAIPGPGIIKEPACHRELLVRWSAGDDSVSGFVSGYCEDCGPDKATWTPTASLYEAYVAWCKWVYGDFRATRETQSKTAFAKALAGMQGQGVQTGKSGGSRVTNRRVRKAEAA